MASPGTRGLILVASARPRRPACSGSDRLPPYGFKAVASLEQATYELALRALAQPEQALTEIRARTGTLLTASSLIASFLGAEAIARNGLNVWIVLALVAFGVSVVLSIYVLLPKEGLIFALDAPETYEALYDVRDDEEEFARTLAPTGC
jgi:hypothetical protein